MITLPKQLIIIGGGFSLKEGLSKGLKYIIKNKFVIGCNYAFRYFNNLTLTAYVDRDFYKYGDASFSPEQRKKHREFLRNLSFIIGQEITEKNIKKFINTYYISSAYKYKRNLKEGIYKASLVGIYALSLAIYLLDEGEIFLLGYDFGEARKSPQELNKIILKDKRNRPITHFYQEREFKKIVKTYHYEKGSIKSTIKAIYEGGLNHRGIGKVNYYNAKDRAKNDFGVYANEQKIKIYNVSLISKIPIFPKISYDQFFKMLDNNVYNQKELKKEILKKLEVLKCI